MFRLRFPEGEIEHWAARYQYAGERELIAGPVAAARQRGYLRMPEFLEIARWKTPRSRSRCAKNDPSFVEEVTRLALQPNTSPRLRIESLTLLSGVEWPTASVILHFCHREPYPIVDFRALWSLSCAVPARYDYPFWVAYTEFARGLCRRVDLDSRTLDRALWQYSKERQNGA
ncbi:MAG: hypothetical protein Q8Q85_01125 [Gemmatimonadales bacterium]|nr:hypothetical protein [Gemmatimonadales bacterium]